MYLTPPEEGKQEVELDLQAEGPGMGEEIVGQSRFLKIAHPLAPIQVRDQPNGTPGG